VAQLFSLGGITRVMDSETWTQNLDETVALISRWRGNTVIAEQYIAGHGRFLLRLVRQDGTRRSAYLQCGDCQVIQLFRTQWTDADIPFHPHHTDSARFLPSQTPAGFISSAGVFLPLRLRGELFLSIHQMH